MSLQRRTDPRPAMRLGHVLQSLDFNRHDRDCYEGGCRPTRFGSYESLGFPVGLRAVGPPMPRSRRPWRCGEPPASPPLWLFPSADYRRGLRPYATRTTIVKNNPAPTKAPGHIGGPSSGSGPGGVGGGADVGVGPGAAVGVGVAVGGSGVVSGVGVAVGSGVGEGVGGGVGVGAGPGVGWEASIIA